MYEPFSSSLWHWLHNVMPRHPLHWTRLGKSRLSFGREWLYRGVASVLPVVLFFNTGGLLFTPSVFIVLVMLPLVIITAAAGLVTSTTISGMINREREHGRYDLMGLTPSGSIGAGWVIAARQLRNNLHILYMKQLAFRCFLGVFVMLLVVLLGYLANHLDTRLIPVRSRPPLMFTMLPAVNGLVLFAMLCADYFQSMVSASLIGMAVPTFTNSRLEGFLYSFTAFLLLQMLVYLLVAMVWLFTALFALSFTPVPGMMTFLTMFLVREAVNFGLLRLLIWRANADSPELAVTLRSGL